MPGDHPRITGSTTALRAAVRRHPRTGEDLHPPGPGARTVAVSVSCRSITARHLRTGSCRDRAVRAWWAAAAAENPQTDCEIPDYRSTSRGQTHLRLCPPAI